MLLAATGCVDRTSYGRCVGLNTPRDSSLVYDYSTRNVVVGLLLSETVIVPVVVAFKQLECPVARVAPHA